MHFVAFSNVLIAFTLRARCNMHFQHMFTAGCCIVEVITMVLVLKQCDSFDNVAQPIALKTTLGPWLDSCLFSG